MAVLFRRFGSHLILFLPLHPDTGAPFEERAIAVWEEPNLHFEFFQRVTDGMRSSWKTFIDVVSRVSCFPFAEIKDFFFCSRRVLTAFFTDFLFL